MQILKALGLAVVAATALAGCDTLTGGPLVRPGTATGTLVIVNGSFGNLDAVVIADCGAMSYGFNRLGSSDYIPPGGERAFTLSAGCWDVGGGEFGGGEAYQRLTIVAGGVMRLTIND